MQTYNVNSLETKSINSAMFPNDKGVTNWKEFLISNYRKEEYFKLGRPLTYEIFRELVRFDFYDLKAKFEDCREFRFMACKIFGGKEYGNTDNISLLYAMFNFAFGTNLLPSFVSKEYLIEYHLMTLVEYLDEHELGTQNVIGGFSA